MFSEVGGNYMIKKELTAVGCFLLFISAFLYVGKHITAAIMTAYINSPDVNYFGGGYQTVGFGMTFWIGASFLFGMILIIIGIFPAFKRRIVTKNTNTQQADIDN